MELDEILDKIDKFYLDKNKEKFAMAVESELAEEMLRHLKIYKLVKGNYQNLMEQNKKLQEITTLFNDPYFKGLYPKDIIGLAKKSIRLGAYNSELEDAIQQIQVILENTAITLDTIQLENFPILDSAMRAAIKICWKNNPHYKHSKNEEENEKI